MGDSRRPVWWRQYQARKRAALARRHCFSGAPRAVLAEPVYRDTEIRARFVVLANTRSEIKKAGAAVDWQKWRTRRTLGFEDGELSLGFCIFSSEGWLLKVDTGKVVFGRYTDWMVYR